MFIFVNYCVFMYLLHTYLFTLTTYTNLRTNCAHYISIRYNSTHLCKKQFYHIVVYFLKKKKQQYRIRIIK